MLRQCGNDITDSCRGQDVPGKIKVKWQPGKSKKMFLYVSKCFMEMMK